ncbi:hypothetical protein Tco_0805706 [Tanacetum coccineum]
MKEIESLRKENSILKKEDNPKRKAIASECKSEESSDKPIPTIKTQEISHCSSIKEDMFKTHMFVSNRGRGGYSTFAHEKVNQLVGLFNCDPNLIKATYDYGLLHSVYTKDGSELCKIPEVYEQAKYYLKITKATMIYVRFYGAVGEVTFEEIIHTTRLVKMGLTRDFILSEKVTKQNQLCFEEIPQYLTKKRAWSLKTMSDAIKEIIKTPFRLNFYKLNLIIVSNAREYDTDGPKVLEKIYWKILSPEDMDTKVFAKNYLSEKGFEYLCKNLYFEESHKCRYCGKGETGVPELFNFEDIPEEASTSQNDESNDETI